MTDQQKYTQKLAGTKILILGGSSGIGYGVAEASLENGAEVFISSSNESRIKESVSRLQKAYPSKNANIKGFTCNLNSEKLEENIVQLLDSVGTVDHIIFTAGDRLATMPLADTTLETVRQAGMLRFFAPILLAKHAPRYLTPGPKSSITLTTGAVSQKPLANWSTVAGYAGGLHSLTRNLALDLKPIRVNLISPGAVDTDLWAGMDEEKKRDFFANIAKVTTTGKVAGVESVAEAYLYAMKDDNLSGSVISTNGGNLLM